MQAFNPGHLPPPETGLRFNSAEPLVLGPRFLLQKRFATFLGEPACRTFLRRPTLTLLQTALQNPPLE